MKIVDKMKFIIRIIEIMVVVTSIILTPIAINYANQTRGYQAYGGEYLTPLFGFLLILIIDDIYETIQSSKQKKGKK